MSESPNPKSQSSESPEFVSPLEAEKVKKAIEKLCKTFKSPDVLQRLGLYEIIVAAGVSLHYARVIRMYIKYFKPTCDEYLDTSMKRRG